MKKNRFQEYITQSLAGFGSLALAILFFFALYEASTIFAAVGKIVSILMPVIYGAVIAFILTPLCNRIQKWLEKRLPSDEKRAHARLAVIKGVSVTASILIALVVVYLILVLMMPQLFDSIVNLVNNVPAMSERILGWIQNAFSSNPDLQTQVIALYDNVGDYFLDWVQNTLIPQFQTMLNGVSGSIISFLSVLGNLFVGIIVSVYLMFNRRLYAGQAKKALYSLTSPKWGNRILMLVRDISDTFSGFIIGKLLDSLIIGVLCGLILTILNFPYAILISTIVGVTNIIPYFGPFIGAVPCALLLLTVRPILCVYFLILILVLQQVDGNFIGPKILGRSTGLSSFWILFSLLLFGGLFGFVGMLIGVPVFAVIYDLATQGVTYLLRQKQLPEDSHIYESLDSLDPETGGILLRPEKKKKTTREKLSERREKRGKKQTEETKGTGKAEETKEAKETEEKETISS